MLTGLLPARQEEMTTRFATEIQQLSCNTTNKIKAILHNNKPILMKI
jgi:surfactin synthase thioesterase subunit